MCVTQFITQRQLMSKNMPPDALNGPYAQQQKILLYVLPVVFAVGGVAFPLGVLFYWTTSNLWTMGQQFYVIRNNPAPGTPAFKAKQDRDDAKHGKTRRRTTRSLEANAESRTRQQPKNQPRSQREEAAAADQADASPAVTPQAQEAGPSPEQEGCR